MAARRGVSESLPFTTGLTGLRVPAALERLTALAAERARLLTKIAKVKTAIERLVVSTQDAAAAVAPSLAPLAHEIFELERELHALFRELLAKGRLRPRPHREVKRLYEMLQVDGFLERLEEMAPAASDEDGAPDGPWGSFNLPHEHESGAASEPGDPTLAEAVRAVFRRLARALHPDGVQDPAEQARRTEAMKELTQAHRLGDLARLLELERTWLENWSTEGAGSVDETERRCAALVETNAALVGQLRTLERELRALRKSEPVQLMKNIDRARKIRGGAHRSTVVEDATADRDRYRDVRDLVRDFRDGKATLAQLIAGPESLSGNVDELLDSEFGALLEEMFAAVSARAPNARPTAKGRRPKK